jgi:transposase InsO family protein
MLCRVLGVSRAGYYAWRARGPSERESEDAELVKRIRVVHADNRGVYGSPRVHRELRAQGELVGRHRIARLMRETGLRAVPSRKYHPSTTDSSHPLPIAPNVLERQFEVPAPNHAWVADITYVGTREGWLYLAIVLDLFSRRVVGWSMSDRIDQSLTLSALGMAVQARRPRAGLVHHSDRGCQYAGESYRRALAELGLRASMSRKGNCWDNAVAESFFRSLKVECCGGVFVTRQHARKSLFDYIERFYNRRRRHSSLGYVSPMDFEKMYWSTNPKAA